MPVGPVKYCKNCSEAFTPISRAALTLKVPTTTKFCKKRPVEPYPLPPRSVAVKALAYQPPGATILLIRVPGEFNRRRGEPSEDRGPHK